MQVDVEGSLGSQFGTRGALLGVSCKYPGSLLGILMNLCARSLLAWTSQRYEEQASQALPSCPPPGPELHFSFGRGGALVREGGFLCNARKAEFRTYGSSVCF